MINIHRPVFEDAARPTGVPARGSRRARLGWQLGAERIGMSLWEVPAGQPAYAYHYHLAAEEIVIVLVGGSCCGRPRASAHWSRAMRSAFRPAKRVRTDSPTTRTSRRAFSPSATTASPDVVVWPESQKLGIFELRAGGPGLRAIFRLADATMYLAAEGRESP